MISPEQIERMQEKQDELLVRVTETSTNLISLCKKFDAFLETGGVRCAHHEERIDSVRKGVKVLFTWMAAVTAVVLTAVWNHIFG